MLRSFAPRNDAAMEKRPAVYIVTNRKNGTIYTGVTSNLSARVWQHRERVNPGFSSRYGCDRLVWFELHSDMPAAIAREKQIKAGSRQKKMSLIEATNPHWHDLFPGIAHS